LSNTALQMEQDECPTSLLNIISIRSVQIFIAYHKCIIWINGSTYVRNTIDYIELVTPVWWSVLSRVGPTNRNQTNEIDVWRLTIKIVNFGDKIKRRRHNDKTFSGRTINALHRCTQLFSGAAFIFTYITTDLLIVGSGNLV